MRSPYAPAIAAGTGVGIVVLGWIGRIATAGVALALGLPANLTVAGLVEATLVGAIGGATGGFLLAVLAGKGVTPPLRGLAAGGSLFVLSAALAATRGRLPLGAGMAQAATTIVVAGVFFAFGVILDVVVERSGSFRSGGRGPDDARSRP